MESLAEERSSCVGRQLQRRYNPAYVFYVIFVGLLGAFVGLNMMKDAKLNMDKKNVPAYTLYILSSALSVGGSLIWAAHFIEVESVSLRDCHGHKVYKSFELKLVLYAFLLSILSASISMHLVFGGPKVSRRRRKKKDAHNAEYKSLFLSGNGDGDDDMDSSRHSGSSAGSMSSAGMSEHSVGSVVTDSGKTAETGKTYNVKLWTLDITLESMEWKRYIPSIAILTVGAFLVPHYMISLSQRGPYVAHYHLFPIVLKVFVSFICSCSLAFACVQTARTAEVVKEYAVRCLATFLVTGNVTVAHYLGVLEVDYEYLGHTGRSFTEGWYTTYIVISGEQVALLSLAMCIAQLVITQYMRDRLREHMAVVQKKLTQKLPDNVQEVLEEVYDRIVGVDEGEVATYIPELANCDPDKFAIALCDIEGKTYTVGDCLHAATIQSVGKTMLYILAMADAGRVDVDRKIGQEPSGKAFNELAIDSKNRAYNALINTGALVSTSFIKGSTAQEKYELFERRVKKCVYAPENIHMDESVYESEWSTCDNNRNLTKQLVERKVIEEPEKTSKQSKKKSGARFGDFEEDKESKSEVEPQDYGEMILDAYTRACSLNISCLDLAVLAGTFANGGKHPITGKKALSRPLVDHLITVMMSCGMYNGAGKWIVDVGIPAKSGVAGFLLCVVPGVCGFAIYSPRLDAHGNTRRGILVCEALSTALNLHILKQNQHLSAKEGASRGPDAV